MPENTQTAIVLSNCIRSMGPAQVRGTMQLPPELSHGGRGAIDRLLPRIIRRAIRLIVDARFHLERLVQSGDETDEGSWLD